MAVTALAVAAVATIRILAPDASAPDGPDPPASLFPAPQDATRLGILPFDDLGAGQGDDEHLTAALREAITIQVSKVGALAVVRSPTRFRDVSTFPLAAMADSLRVRYLLGGSVLRDGGRIRVTAWIHEAVEACEVWREPFDGEVSALTLLAIQAAVALGWPGSWRRRWPPPR